MKALETEVEDLRKAMKRFERKQQYTFEDWFGARIVSGEEAERTLEGIERQIEKEQEDKGT